MPSGVIDTGLLEWYAQAESGPVVVPESQPGMAETWK